MVKKIKKIKNIKKLKALRAARLKKTQPEKFEQNNKPAKLDINPSQAANNLVSDKKRSPVKRKKPAKILKFDKKKKKPKGKTKFKFDDDTKLLSPASYIRKVVYIAIVIASFAVGKFGVLDKTIDEATKIESDLTTKSAFLETGPTTKQTIEKKHEALKEEFAKIQSTFFIVNKSDEFYEFLTSNAIKHNVKIVSLNKVKEDFYKVPKKDKKGEFDVFENYKQSIYDLTFEANFVDFKNYINTIKEGNKSLVTNTASIETKDPETVTVKTRLTLNFINL